MAGAVVKAEGKAVDEVGVDDAPPGGIDAVARIVDEG